MPDMKLRIMAFGAHAADPIDLAGGTLARYAKSGHELVVIALSLGAKSHIMKKASLEELRNLKRSELERACAQLGVKQVRCLEYDEDPLCFGREQVSEIVNLIREIRPDIILTHHAHGDVVPDHSETGRTVWHASHCAGRPGFESALPVHIVKGLFTYGVGKAERAQRLTGTPMILPDFYIDISDTIRQKVKALEEFATQHYTPEFNERRIQRIEGHYGMEVGVDYAEGFYSVKPIVLDELPLSRGIPNFGRKVEGN